MRLLFAVVLAVVWGRHRVPVRDLAGSVAITVGLVGFIFSARPHKATMVVPDLH